MPTVCAARRASITWPGPTGRPAVRTLAEGPVLQVGSKQAIVDRSPRRWRTLLEDRDFTGLDIEAGENVDRVADIGGDFAALDEALGGRRFGFIVCPHGL